MTERVVVPFELRSDPEAGTRRFGGYGSVFHVIDSYDDLIEHGAFRESLAEWRARGRWPPMLWQHQADEVVGLWREIREDDIGLWVEGELADITRGREAYELLRLRALSGLSIGFRTRRADLDETTGIRRIREIELWEISLVTFPANEWARVTAVKQEALPSVREFERLLRTIGFSRAQARAIVARGYGAVHGGGDDQGSGAGGARPRVRDSRVVDALRALQATWRSV